MKSETPLMSLDNSLSQTKQKHFSAGCDMWILVNNPDSFWWKQINFFTGFLLSSLNQKIKNGFTNSISQETENILNLTDLPHFNFKSDSRIVYVCVENHFQTRWLCLLPSAQDLGSDELLRNLKNLKCNNFRLFSSIDVPTSLKASFPDLQIVSDSH
jgi:hypothetical protein